LTRNWRQNAAYSAATQWSIITVPAPTRRMSWMTGPQSCTGNWMSVTLGQLEAAGLQRLLTGARDGLVVGHLLLHDVHAAVRRAPVARVLHRLEPDREVIAVMDLRRVGLENVAVLVGVVTNRFGAGALRVAVQIGALVVRRRVHRRDRHEHEGVGDRVHARVHERADRLGAALRVQLVDVDHAQVDGAAKHAAGRR
jgi:hypothetical protein